MSMKKQRSLILIYLPLMSIKKQRSVILIFLDVHEEAEIV
jgi:hypothetical protein